jgi:hypothetical protein
MHVIIADANSRRNISRIAVFPTKLAALEIDEANTATARITVVIKKNRHSRDSPNELRTCTKFSRFPRTLARRPLDLLLCDWVDRILRGSNPAELPVQTPTKYKMVANLRTARALRLDVPLRFQQFADEVTE